MPDTLTALARAAALREEHHARMCAELAELLTVRPDIERWCESGLNGKPGDSMAIEVTLRRVLDVLHHFERR